ncbi:hypothetical protein [Streptomyces sp. CB01881]|uniref:hypothetical protein n=1 Tax=Streptomyces sp. CB01881 TaxID=2078691 RepID=UPI0011DF5E35|nr:hypothetical protein [Streptomyces sp. CB01881]TYC68778.1 hypothetical protein EH183_38655 [Streptomyces sp. CB01881]
MATAASSPYARSPKWSAPEPGATRYGRLDTVIRQLGAADIVMEIDSAPNPSSAAKLAFARDAGAVPVWIRFGKGGIDAPNGVAVIDLRAPVRELQTGACG